MMTWAALQRSGSYSVAELSSSFPKYWKALQRYLVSSTNIQNFIPDLSGLFVMSRVNLHLALDGKSCSSPVRFSPGLAEKAVISEPLPCFRSQCKFVTLQTLRTCSFQIKSHTSFTKSVSRHGIREKTKSPIYIPQHIVNWPAAIPTRAYARAINASSSSMASDQFSSPALAASASVQRLIWRRIESMNNRQAEETVLRHSVWRVGPGSLRTLWLRNLPEAPHSLSMTVHFVSLSLPTYSVSGCPMNFNSSSISSCCASTSCTAPCLSNILCRHKLLLHIIFQFFLQPTSIFRIAVTWWITCSAGWLVIIPIWVKGVMTCIRLVFRNVLELQDFFRFEVTGSMMHADQRFGLNCRLLNGSGTTIVITWPFPLSHATATAKSTLSSIQIGKSMMKSGNVTALPSVYRDRPTNTPRTNRHPSCTTFLLI